MLSYPSTSIHIDYSGNRIGPLIKITGDIGLLAVYFFNMWMKKNNAIVPFSHIFPRNRRATAVHEH